MLKGIFFHPDLFSIDQSRDWPRVSARSDPFPMTASTWTSVTPREAAALSIVLMGAKAAFYLPVVTLS